MTFRKNISWSAVGIDRSSDLQRGHRLTVQLDQHVILPFCASLTIDHNMKSANRRAANMIIREATIRFGLEPKEVIALEHTEAHQLAKIQEEIS